MSPRPPVGQFLSPTGLDPDVADATNVRGATGPGQSGVEIASETETEEGTSTTKVPSVAALHAWFQHVEATQADVDSGTADEWVPANVLLAVRNALQAAIDQKHDSASIFEVANKAIADSDLTDAQKRAWRLRVDTLAKEGEWTDPVEWEREQGPQPSPPYTTSVNAGIVYDSGISISDADDVRLLTATAIENGVGGTLSEGWNWIELLGDRIRALPATVSRNVLLDPNRQTNTIELRFQNSNQGTPDRIVYLGRTAAGTLLVGVGDDSDGYIGMFAETRNAEIARWAQGGNTDRIPKSKLPTDTSYTASPLPTPTAQNRGDAVFVDSQGQFELRAITGADVPGDEFTTAEKTKLDGIEERAQVNVKPDWNALASTPAGILNKPDVPQVVSALQPPQDALPDFRLRQNGGVYDVFAKGATPTPTGFRFTPDDGLWDSARFGGRAVGSSVDMPTEAGAWAVQPVYLAAAIGAGRLQVQLLVDEALFTGSLPATLDYRVLDPANSNNVVFVGSGVRSVGGDRGLARSYNINIAWTGGEPLADGHQYLLQVGGAGSSGNAYDPANLYNLLSPYRWNLIVANLVDQVDARMDTRLRIVANAAARPAGHATDNVLYAWN